MAGIIKGKDIVDGSIAVEKLEEGVIAQDVYLTGDLSVVGSNLPFTFGTITVLVTRQDSTTATISLTTSSDIQITITYRLSGNNTLITNRTTYNITSTPTQIPSLSLGSQFIAEYWIRKSDQLYYITAGSNSDYSDCWIDIETKHLDEE